MKVMISACLAGINCKYNGGNNLHSDLMAWLEDKQVITVCPETAGGLPVPRNPGEIVAGVVRNADGRSVDAEYRSGAEKMLAIAMQEKPALVILQSRSPSCGVNQIYDGTFSGRKIPGSGVFAALMKANGFRVLDVEDFARCTESEGFLHCAP